MKTRKEAWIATKPKHTDLSIYVDFWRDDDLVATVETVLDRDTGLMTAAIGSVGFNADVVTLSFESFWTPAAESPATHREWRHREMQYVRETQSEGKEVVKDALTTIIQDREEHGGMLSQPYELMDDLVIWGEPTNIWDTELEASGLMHSYLRDAMSKPKLSESMEDPRIPVPPELVPMLTMMNEEPEVGLLFADLSTMRMLSERQGVTAIMLRAQEGTLRHQLLEKFQ